MAVPKTQNPEEICAICGCVLTRERGTYASPTVKGRSHATEHHYVAERFFGRSANRRGEKRRPIFKKCPWDNLEHKKGLFCYDCHEVLLHNPVFTPDDIEGFKKLVEYHGFDEAQKSESMDKLGERIRLLQRVIQKGIKSIMEDLAARHGFEP